MKWRFLRMGKVDGHTLERRERDSVPGPGNYTVNQSERKIGGAWGRSGEKQIPDSLAERAKVPGAGSYEINPNYGKRSAPKIGFGTISHETSVNKNDKPGPGSYQPDLSKNIGGGRSASISGGPSTSQGGRLSSSDQARANIGPGSYSVTNNMIGKGAAPNAPSYSMGTLRPLKDSANPGPGQYESYSNLVKPRAPAYRYNSGNREIVTTDGKGRDTPAVGQYNLKSLIGAGAGGKSSMGARLPTRDRSDSPGPGQYLSNKDTSSFSRNNAIGNSVISSANFGKNSEPRLPNANTLSQGPGAYEIKSTLRVANPQV